MFSLGIDFGTSGARAIAISCPNATSFPNTTSFPNVDERYGGRNWDEPCEIVAEAAFKFADYAPKDPGDSSLTTQWRDTLFALISAIPSDIRIQIQRIAVNGTSATMMLCNERGDTVEPPLMYNDTSAKAALAEVRAIAPPNSPTISATSTLTKALWLSRNLHLPATDEHRHYIAHQADWLSFLLHRQPRTTDYHNALKLGYDVQTLSYPNWLLSSSVAPLLPDVVAPGERIGPVHAELADHLGLARDCQICAGTTDSIAAFLASGARQTGEAVTSLGSTLVIKLLSADPVDDQHFGIYSHRLGSRWLCGGASNTGGAVLSRFFSPEQISTLSAQINPNQPCALNYYPLLSPGERFPINDPDYLPRLTPRPDSERDFLHGLLEGMAQIEADGYQKLNDLGAPTLRRVYTAGGGAQNKTWRTIRQRKLGVEVTMAAQTAAAYGTALLAMHGLSSFL